MHKNPEMTLNRLRKYSTSENPKFNRLYNCLYSMEFYKLAYSNIYSKPGNMTEASDGTTIDGMSEERINKLIQSFKDGTYQPKPVRRANIPKKNGKTRPISIPSFDDKLVQEIIRMILEAIYENTFSDHSHGFRPNRSCHTALETVRHQFQGISWYIKCDIPKCFNNIEHVILLNILRERIIDLRFIHLINLFLKAGYIEDWKYYRTYSGTPQGSIISPILTNIYLDKFDKFMEGRIRRFNVGKVRPQKKEYHRLVCRVYQAKKNLREGHKDKEKNKEMLKINEKAIRNYDKITVDEMSPKFKRLTYVRYADDFLIGVIGSKQEAMNIYEEIKIWLQENFKLVLSSEKNQVYHNSEKIRFLGYDIIKVKNAQKKQENGNIRLSVPFDIMVNFIIRNRYGKWKYNPKSKKDELCAIYRPELMYLDELEILNQYNCKIRGLYNYYCLAENVHKMNGFGNLIQTSLMKTLAAKHKTVSKKLYENPNYSKRKNGKTIVGITYKEKFYQYFDGPFKKQRCEICIDEIPNINKFQGRSSIIQRMEAHVCEICGNTDGPFEIHHVRKLKDLKGKANWEKLMISRRRKTLVLCIKCHDKLHAGKL